MILKQLVDDLMWLEDVARIAQEQSEASVGASREDNWSF